MANPSSESPSLPENEYAETLATIRHYSNLRFVVLTLFSVVTAGLFTAAFGTTVDNPILRARTQIILPAVGLVASFLFLVLEVSIDQYILTCRRMINEFWPQTHISRMSLWSRRTPPRVVRGLYILSIMFWTLAMLNR